MKHILTTAIAVTTLALAALLMYSLERTAWLFSQYETWPAAAIAAAVVVELCAIALIVSASALARLDTRARAWANRALGVVLAVSALANLAAGFLRGGRLVGQLFAPGNELALWALSAVLLLTTNMAIPALIFFLSKLLERLVDAAVRRRPYAAQRRALVVRLVRTLRDLRATVAHEVSQARADAQALVQARDMLAQQAQVSAQLTEQVAHAQQTIARIERELAQAQSQLAQLPQVEGLDLLALAQALREPRAVDWRRIEHLLSTPQSTLRSRLERQHTNGHADERNAS
jgi:hypothetical protein